MNKLDEIIAAKKEHVKTLKMQRPIYELEDEAKNAPECRGFYDALKKQETDGHFGLIAELKKSSPSKGTIREDYDPAAIAKAYEKGGATCLSVLTDEEFFAGNIEHLKQAKEACNLPILRKDFIIDKYQIYESKIIGADAILLIVAALPDDKEFVEFETIATSLGLDVLVEAHDKFEVMRALYLKTHLIGINNRDLKTLEIDLANAENLSRHIPGSYLRVCESGIYSHQDLLRMRKSWFNTFLVGESLMSQGDITEATKKLLQG